MKVEITARHFSPSDHLKELIHEKIKKIEKFNNGKDDLRLVMQIYNPETFRDDGVIVDTKTGKRIIFDWEIRDRYFTTGKFSFKESGQFERKLKKGEIGLSLQCDQDETAVMAAWHEGKVV